MMRKGVKVWSVIVILVVVGTVFSGMVSAADVSEEFTRSVADAEIQTALDEDPLHQLPATSGKIMVMMKKARLP
jgi:hypothetical protein